MATDPTNLVGGDDTSVTDTVDTDTGVTDDAANLDTEVQYDDDGNPIVPDDDEEVDLGDDLKLKVPKTAAQKLKELQEGSLRQADYTRKTQELAEQRKTIEAERTSFQQASQQERQTEAAILAMDTQLAQFANVNWGAEMQAAENNFDDARKAQIQAAFMQYSQLKDARSNAAAQYFNLRQQRELETQQATAKQIEEGRNAVAQIPGWSDKVATELKSIATSPEIGFTADEIGDEIAINPKVAKALLLAREGLEARRAKAKAQSHVQAQQAQPAAKAGSGSSAPPKGLDDRLSAEEWVRRRNAQVAKTKGR